MAVNRRMDRETVGHPYSVAQAGNKEEWAINTHGSSDPSQNKDAEFF